MSEFNTLTHGELRDVAEIVDRRALSDGEIGAVLLNLIRRIQRLEADAAKAREIEASRRGNPHGAS